MGHGGTEPGDQPDFWGFLLRIRAVATLVLPLVLLGFGSFGPARFALAAAAIVIGGITNVHLRRRVRRGRSIRGPLATIDTLAVLIALAVIPEAYPLGTVLLTAIASLYVFWFGGERAVRLVVPTSMALAAIGMWHRPHMWLPIWIAWAAGTTLGAVPISRMATVAADLRNRHDDMVNGVDAVLWEAHGPSSNASFVSDRSWDLFGYRPEELCSFSDLLQRVDVEDRSRVIDSRRRAAAGEDVEVHYTLIDADGARRQVQERIRCSSAGRAGQVRRGVIVDETARWQAERSARSYADFVERLPIALAILHLDDPRDPHSLRVVVGNPEAAALVDRDANDVVGRRLGELMPLSDMFATALADVTREEEILHRPFIRIDHLDAVFSLRAIPLPGGCVGLMLEDVTDRARQSRSLEHQATHDHLTGLANRAMFNERLTRALERSLADDRGVTVLMMDLNQFKDVNDTLGHETGDLLLIELARRLTSELRYCDTIARLGGDEFAVLLSDTDGPEVSRGVARRVVSHCEEPFEIEGYRLQIGTSIGLAHAPQHGTDARALMRLADRAMYRAKADGGGIVEYCAAQDTDGATRMGLLEDLRTAVRCDELVVHYQPRFELATGRVVGVEALVRWSHPHRGLLIPSDFLELAEMSGEIDSLTDAVVARAAADVTSHPHTARLDLAVNLSRRSLHHPDLVEWVTQMLQRHRLDAASLCFEIPAADLTDDPESVRAALDGLHRLGVVLSIDDFGTGPVPLHVLSELPVDQVKLDPRLIEDVERDPAVVGSLIELSHSRGLHVVAEGVETEGTLGALQRLGCDSAQGFHLGAPVPFGELLDQLDAEVLAAVDDDS